MTQASVTDEMVDAALKSWYLVLTKDKHADMRVALEAALSTQPKAVSVERLEALRDLWKDDAPRYYVDCLTAIIGEGD